MGDEGDAKLQVVFESTNLSIFTKVGGRMYLKDPKLVASR